MKFLYVTTIGGTMIFFRRLIRELIEDGHTVEIAANTGITDVPEEYFALGCRVHRIDCVRTPFSRSNLTAVRQLRDIVREGGFDIVHCHTPVAAAVTRLACRTQRKSGLRVFYTAHGFHFYRGAPLKNWLLYYPAERICAPMTDVLITINHEDYTLAQRKLHAGRVAYVPGVGVDIARFADAAADAAQKRAEIGVPADAFLLLSVGELNENKNHAVVIRALAELNDPHVHYAIAGKGGLRDALTALAQSLGVGDRVHLLGYRRDIPELYKSADACVFPSIREGLGLAAIEGMAAGLPLIVSDSRGAKMYAENNVNAIVCPLGCAPSVYAGAIARLRDDGALRAAWGEYNRRAAWNYDIGVILPRMREIYGI